MNKSIDSKKLKELYLKFFKQKKHAIILNAPLIPEEDPTVLFTTAGMHPLVRYLLGQSHPLGKRLTNVQKCLRTDDIESVGDDSHLTFFEMLGNWSLGDYWKEDAIKWSWEFLTAKKWLGIPKEKLYISVFAGDKDAPRDKESARIWRSLGIPKERIFYFPKNDNWWGPAGNTGPCGPDTEMFYDTGKKPCGKDCKPGCSCGKYFEVWNDVFMEYNKASGVILVDGMHTLYDKEFKINKDILDFLNSLSNKKIVVVNGYRDRAKQVLGDNWEIFSLEEEGIKKDNPEFFKKLIREYNLDVSRLIYLDHVKENIDSAKRFGILSEQYRSNDGAIKFIESNAYVFLPLKQKNVDTGMGVERTIAMLQNKKSVYEVDSFKPIVEKIKETAKIKSSDDSQERSVRIIADHVKASTFILSEDISPSNVDRGYVLRRLLRRAIRYGKLIGIEKEFLNDLVKIVIDIYKGSYPNLEKKKEFILTELKKEETKFRNTLEKGLKKFEEITNQVKRIDGKNAFLLFQSFGFPIEMTKELAKEMNIAVDEKGFEEEFGKHQQISRVGAEKKFKGGLSDASEQTTKLHTATHLLNESLRRVLKKKDLVQKGSNITPERLRFDFNFDRPLTQKEINDVEKLVSEQIKKGLSVVREEMTFKEAKRRNAQAVFEQKYDEKVSVYSVGDFSIEVCGGPHVKNTKELGEFKIIKEEGIAAGIRRIKAIVK